MIRAALTLLVATGVVLGTPRSAIADPEVSRVLTAPTAWLPRAGTVIGMAGVDHRLAGHLVVGYGLGGLAAVELGTESEVRSCTACDETPRATWLGRASFRIGARQDAWVKGMPALVLGVRNTFASSGPFEDQRVTEAYVVASRVLGPVRVHAGASAIAAGTAEHELSPTVRPLAGLEWTPSQYPRTSLLGDVAWTVRFEPTGPALEWLAGWGVRYQAFTWASIELAVRHRQDEDLAQSTVLMRVNAVWDPSLRRRSKE